MSGARDSLGRPLRDLRISVTDRCNMRCSYCMPAEVFGPGYPFLPRDEILTFEEITRVVQVAVSLGVRKVRLTGGEPLLRRDLALLLDMLTQVEGIEDLAMTTNGLLLSPLVRRLKDAGLRRLTVSLDALDDALFRRMTGTKRPVADVLEGLAAARAAGLPVKINCVVRRGVNQTEILPLAHFCREEGYTLRFIEYMDVGNHISWDPSSVVSAREIQKIMADAFAFAPLDPLVTGEVARRYRYLDGAGEIGFITAISQPFCRDCNRARLTADGKLMTCLFATGGTDLRARLRGGSSDAGLADFLRGVWGERGDRYSELRAEAAGEQLSPKVEMSYVGG